MAIVYSGDGGWRDIDKDIADRLHELGMPVVGVDSLRYFWSEQRPKVAAADLAQIIAHYRIAWQRGRVILIGYSFGADVLPFLVNRLPEDSAGGGRPDLAARPCRRRPTSRSTSPAGSVSRAHAGSVPTLPELARCPAASCSASTARRRPTPPARARS